MARIASIAALALAFCFATPVSAETGVAAQPAAPRLTVEQSREAQALFGFDAAIPIIIEVAFKEQPEYQNMTPAQRECVLGLASPAFHGLFDDAFIELFGDSGTVVAWRAFSETPGGRVFLGSIRKVVLSKIKGEPEPDMAATMTAMSDAEKTDIVLFMGSPAAGVMKKGFPDVDLPPGMEKTLLARTDKECGVKLEKL